MKSAIPPHGGTLVNRVLRNGHRDVVSQRAQSLRHIDLDPTRVADLELLVTGAYSPLIGFMTRENYLSVVREMCGPEGVIWPIPIVLPVSCEIAAGLREGDEVALCEGGNILAVMALAEIFGYDKHLEAREVYRTEDEKHPGVASLYAQGEVCLGGEVWLVNWPKSACNEFSDFRFTPTQTRMMFAERGWRYVVGFQTRNPIHRAHEHILKTALELVDGLFLHPLVGETKGDDIPAKVRMRAYSVLLDGQFPFNRAILSVFPAAMRYAGPREAVFHAICRKNYGCTHFIVGRDHAGVGGYYGTYDAQQIFDEFVPGELGITIMAFKDTFYCRECEHIASKKTCPHGEDLRLNLSGTVVRRMLELGEMLPEELTRPEVSRVLIEGLREVKERG